ncbi:hypothetical protein [Fodinicola acaciae]|uniref:hypothetical protein n=1 Tax=Fodinicola acaciae TaxID=2681555 RepID=UPI0013D1A45F|nr:hypothetical protein [Fodinicola acaciae]
MRTKPRLPEGWPLSVAFLGYPLWWVLGIGEFVFLAAAVPLAVALVRRRDWRTPRGFGWWLLFLAMVLVSAALLPAHAPGAVPEAGSPLTYGYRLLWYAAVTVALLYIGTSTVSDLRMSRLLGYMFLVTTIGGLLGVFAPWLDFRSPVEMLLPHSVTGKEFMHVIVHPATAEVQSVLGYVEPRPKAPFTYVNSWGANLSFFLPFFLFSWCRRDCGWRRYVAPFVLAAAAVPVVYSLNRGLWIALGVGAAYGIFQLARAGRTWIVGAAAGAVLVIVLAIVVSPLGEVINERLQHPHSNNRRSALAVATVDSMMRGSPLVGFGNTRDVQGNFFSIAGSGTPDCPACAVPPLGTQGHLWLLLFSQGLVGTAFFLAFLLVRGFYAYRCRDPMAVVALALLLFFGIEMFVYDVLGPPVFTLMLALGLAWRAGRGAETGHGKISQNMAIAELSSRAIAERARR